VPESEEAVLLRLPDRVTGRLTYGFHDGTFVDFERSFDGDPPTQLAGNRFEMSPRHLLTIGAFVSPERGLFGSLVVKYTGDRYMDKRNRALADPFTTVDAGVGYRVNRYEIRFDGRNLADARNPVAESELGDAQYYLMPARELRVTFGLRFWGRPGLPEICLVQAPDLVRAPAFTRSGT